MRNGTIWIKFNYTFTNPLVNEIEHTQEKNKFKKFKNNQTAIVRYNMMKQLLVIGTIIILAADIILGTSLMATTVYAQQSAAPQNMTTTTTNVTNTTAAGAAATNATTTTSTITNLTWFDGKVDQLSPENIQYQHTDPAFAKLAQTTACLIYHVILIQFVSANTFILEKG